jgi:hypothetical protein
MPYKNCPNSPKRKQQAKAKRPTPRRQKPARKFQAEIKSSLFSGSMSYEKVRAPSAVASRMKFSQPKARSTVGGELVPGSSVVCNLVNYDSTTSFELNPGLGDIFPQAAPLARLYSEYRFLSLRFRYMPSVGSNTPGRIVLVMNKDVLSPAPNSFTEAASFAGAVASNVWDTGLTFLAEVGEWKFVRTQAPPANTDQKTYDTGLFSILLENLVTDQPSAGTIIADYIIEYRNRVLGPPPSCEMTSAIGATTRNSATVGYFNFLQNTINPIMTTLPDSTDIDNTLMFLGVPAGYWTLTFSSNLYDAVTSTDFTPFSLNTAGNPIVIYRYGTAPTVIPQWFGAENMTKQGSVSWLIYVPNTPTGDLFSSLDSLELTVTNEVTWGANGADISMMLCRCPEFDPLTGEFPPQPLRRKQHFHRRAPRVKKQEAAQSSIPNATLTALATLLQTSSSRQPTDSRYCSKKDPCMKLSCKYCCDDAGVASLMYDATKRPEKDHNPLTCRCCRLE